jgi:anti-sigma regulatory factor (Ser/Thr protein kinase)
VVGTVSRVCGAAEPGTGVERLFLSPDAASVGLARHAVRSRLLREGLDGLVDDATLLTSELVTNAVLHAATPIGVFIACNADALRVEVRDASAAEPAPQDRPATVPGGLGMHILAACAARWGVDRGPDGKAVWFELSRE